MFKTFSNKFALGVLAAIVLALVGSQLHAQSTSKFVAHLSGRQVRSNAQGQAIFELSEDGTKLNYKLIVANIHNILEAHIQLKATGENSLVVAVLYAGPKINGRFNGVLAEGTITKADLDGPLKGQPLKVLIGEMINRHTYVNVRTSRHLNGEVRGHIKPEEPDTPRKPARKLDD
ncbi:CHRD domain-containing protein [Acidobacteria bacterium AH-259-G07]|nr:CHRD domain-containing protein [Acidobacteria bacterium AH-259-G07]